jgi:hypothetical protein
MSIKIPRTLSIKLLRENYLSKKITPKEVINAIISRANEDKEMNIWINHHLWKESNRILSI